MNEKLQEIQRESWFQQLDPGLEVDLKSSVDSSQPQPDGTAEKPISIESQQPLPTKTVFDPVEYLVQVGATAGTIILLVVAGSAWFESHFGKSIRGWLSSIAAVNQAKTEAYNQQIQNSREAMEKNSRTLRQMVEILQNIEDSQRNVERLIQTINRYPNSRTGDEQ